MDKDIIETFLKAASMQRWNDHIKPSALTELDKQAHKVIIAYMLGRTEESIEDSEAIHWTRLIEGAIFEFLHEFWGHHT